MYWSVVTGALLHACAHPTHTGGLAVRHPWLRIQPWPARQRTWLGHGSGERGLQETKGWHVVC